MLYIELKTAGIIQFKTVILVVKTLWRNLQNDNKPIDLQKEHVLKHEVS